MQIYNSQTKNKEEFKTIIPNEVKMYCCGPTVYDLLHVGNFRGAIFYNLVKNWLEHSGYKVKLVYNYTDVDDKIINRAKTDKVTAKEIAEKYIIEFEKDFNRLQLRKHDVNPKVSDTMPEIIEMIADLIKQDKAYASSNGDVWFSVRAFSQYGKLSNRKIDDLLVGVRIESDEQKKDPLDFALWKHAKVDEPFWDSPWGKGRPGWHIECSAMAKKHLGSQIDIHGGGLDLLFPHHENEIAQSEGANNITFVNFWVHNNLINFSGAKMSKSLGNIMTARNFMDKYNPEILKYLMLSSHYRSVSDLSEDSINNAIKGLARVYSALAAADTFVTSTDVVAGASSNFDKRVDEAWDLVEKSMDDDFNTPEVMARLFEVIRLYNSDVKRGMKANPAIKGKSLALKSFITGTGKLMALFQQEPKKFLMSLDDMLLILMNLKRADVDQLVSQRKAARESKDFKKSDDYRDQLTKMGISVMDTTEGSFWEVIK